jgi:hypothetical protein
MQTVSEKTEQNEHPDAAETAPMRCETNVAIPLAEKPIFTFVVAHNRKFRVWDFR